MDAKDLDRPLRAAQRLVTILAEDGPGCLAIAASSLRPADLAAALELVEEKERMKLFIALPPDLAGEVLEEFRPELRDELLETSDDQRLLHILAEADADDAVYFLDHLDDDRAEKLLTRMDVKLRGELEEQYELPDSTVGRIMHRSLTLVRSFLTAQAAIAHLQGSTGDTTPHALYVIDAEGKLVGVLGFRELLLAPPKAVLSALMERDPVAIALEADREEAARLMQKYDLVSLPVIDKNGHIKGAVTIDDVIDVVQEEATEDMHKMGGIEVLDAPYLLTPFMLMLRKRAGWLSVLFVGEMMTTSVMGHFEGALAANVVLALFIPLIISSGGNSGSQATTLVIRALALREITLRDWWRVLMRELGSGLSLGLLLGFLGFARIVFGHYFAPDSSPAFGPQFLAIGLVVLSSLIGIVLWGSLCGSMLPFILRRCGLDPASASAPLVATLVDVTGLIIYFSMARMVFSVMG